MLKVNTIILGQWIGMCYFVCVFLCFVNIYQGYVLICNNKTDHHYQ